MVLGGGGEGFWPLVKFSKNIDNMVASHTMTTRSLDGQQIKRITQHLPTNHPPAVPRIACCPPVEKDF